MRGAMEKLNILITNDDGIDSPGIWHLWHAVKDFANTTIVAPEHEQSVTALSITTRTPLRIKKREWESGSAFSVNGTPADCVKMAFSVLMEKEPDLVISGINRGTNAGRNVLYSGTCGGAIESTLRGVPSVAFSVFDYANPEFTCTKPYISQVIDFIQKYPLPGGTFLNVNFPTRTEGVKGVKFARQGREYLLEAPSMREHPSEGGHYYWMGMKFLACEEHENSDVTHLKDGYMTAVPVNVGELTHFTHLDQHKELFEKHFYNTVESTTS